jgi:hypothetical protein
MKKKMQLKIPENKKSRSIRNGTFAIGVLSLVINPA